MPHGDLRKFDFCRNLSLVRSVLVLYYRRFGVYQHIPLRRPGLWPISIFSLREKSFVFLDLYDSVGLVPVLSAALSMRAHKLPSFYVSALRGATFPGPMLCAVAIWRPPLPRDGLLKNRWKVSLIQGHFLILCAKICNFL